MKTSRGRVSVEFKVNIVLHSLGRYLNDAPGVPAGVIRDDDVARLYAGASA